MRCRFLICGLFVGCITLLSQLTAQTTKPASQKDRQTPGKTDITTQARELNSASYLTPPTTFRQGHVNPRALDANAVKRTKTGFTIQFPSRAPIPTPTVYKGKLYVSGGFHSKEYYCFDAVSGKLVWGVNLDDDGPTSAVCANDIVVFSTESCTIFALDARTGKHLWSYWLGDPLTSTPTIANGKVYASYPAGGRGAPNAKQQKAVKPPPAQGKRPPNASHVLACFELKTGKILWQRWLDSDVMSAPVAVDNEIYATTFAGTVYKFKQGDGTILSAHRRRATSAPVIVGTNVYLTQRADRAKGDKVAEAIANVERAKETLNYEAARRPAAYLDRKVQGKSVLTDKGKKLDAANGFPAGPPPTANAAAGLMNIGQAHVSTLQAFQGSRILNYRNANYNCMGDELINTDPTNGKIRWKIKLKGDLAGQGGHLAAPPAAAGGQLFLATLEGKVLQIDPGKGTVAKTYRVGSALRSQPAIEGGRIYVGTQDGKVVCIDTGDARFTGWPTWGANMAHTNSAAPAKR